MVAVNSGWTAFSDLGEVADWMGEQSRRAWVDHAAQRHWACAVASIQKIMRDGEAKLAANLNLVIRLSTFLVEQRDHPEVARNRHTYNSQVQRLRGIIREVSFLCDPSVEIYYRMSYKNVGPDRPYFPHGDESVWTMSSGDGFTKRTAEVKVIEEHNGQVEIMQTEVLIFSDAVTQADAASRSYR